MKPEQLQTSYDSIAQAAAAMKVPVAVLRSLKKEGAPGFRGSRVYPAELIPFLKAKESVPDGPMGRTTEKEKLELRKLLRQCEILEVEINYKTGKAWDSNDVKTAWITHLSQANQEWLKVRRSLAPRLAGRSAAECEKILGDGIALGLRKLRGNPYGDGPVICPCCKKDITPKLLTKKAEALSKKAKE